MLIIFFVILLYFQHLYLYGLIDLSRIKHTTPKHFLVSNKRVLI